MILLQEKLSLVTIEIVKHTIPMISWTSMVVILIVIMIILKRRLHTSETLPMINMLDTLYHHKQITIVL